MKKQQVLKYICDLCSKETDYSGVMGLTAKDGELEYRASSSGEKHICVECWQQIEAIQKRLAERVM